MKNKTFEFIYWTCDSGVLFSNRIKDLRGANR